MNSENTMTISHHIARGGFGAVYKGEFKGKDTAYKVLIPREDGKITSSDRKVMENEILILELMKRLKDTHEHVEKCNHPSHHVIEIFAKHEAPSVFSKINSIFSPLSTSTSPSVEIDGRVPDNIGMVLKLFRGLDLTTHLERDKLTFEDIMLIIKQLVETLEYFKDIDFLHFDIKPDNVLYKLATDRKEEKSGKIKIIDLGLSVDASKTEGIYIPEHGFSYLQTDFYRHPMADLGCPLDWRADAWSLGCTIFELITGYPLFRFTNINRLRFLHEVERLNGPMPQDWFESGTAMQKYYDLIGGEYILRPLMRPQSFFRGDYRQVKIVAPMINAARQNNFQEDQVRALADMVIGLVSYYPCPYEFYKEAYLQNTRP